MLYFSSFLHRIFAYALCSVFFWWQKEKYRGKDIEEGIKTRRSGNERGKERKRRTNNNGEDSVCDEDCKNRGFYSSVFPTVGISKICKKSIITFVSYSSSFLSVCLSVWVTNYSRWLLTSKTTTKTFSVKFMTERCSLEMDILVFRAIW